MATIFLEMINMYFMVFSRRLIFAAMRRQSSIALVSVAVSCSAAETSHLFIAFPITIRTTLRI